MKGNSTSSSPWPCMHHYYCRSSNAQRLLVAVVLLFMASSRLGFNDSSTKSSERRVRHLIRRAKGEISDDMPLSEITKLDLSGLGLRRLPEGFEDCLPNLSTLFLSNNKFRQLPAAIGKLPKLQMVAFKDNQMASIHPDALQPQLRWLILTNNKLTHIPDTIARCTHLKKLMLSGNKLTRLPDSIQKCQDLELIRLASNQLAMPPLKLFQLPNLRWAGLSDNPCLPDIQTPKINTLTDVDASKGAILGSGASGETRKVTYHGTNGQEKTVAVKVYRGQLTSDGLPEMERQIAIYASQDTSSSAFVHVLGATTDGSLVMEFLQGFRAVGQPPNLETCTRDTYDESHDGLQLSQGKILVGTVLEGLTRLHAMGIMHGDLYAHNILLNRENSQVRLSDFGAAFFYDSALDYGKLLQRVELRAFATFVDEMASLVSSKDGDTSSSLGRFDELRDACLDPNATFSSVHAWWNDQQQH